MICSIIEKFSIVLEAFYMVLDYKTLDQIGLIMEFLLSFSFFIFLSFGKGKCSEKQNKVMTLLKCRIEIKLRDDFVLLKY